VPPNFVRNLQILLTNHRIVYWPDGRKIAKTSDEIRLSKRHNDIDRLNCQTALRLRSVLIGNRYFEIQICVGQTQKKEAEQTDLPREKDLLIKY
jgi:hypothetical protein